MSAKPRRFEGQGALDAGGTLVANLTGLVKALVGPEMKLPPAAIPKFNHLYQELTRIDERRRG